VLFCVSAAFSVVAPSTFKVLLKSTALLTVSVLDKVVPPVTARAPAISVLPVAPATINLLVLTIIDPPMLALEVVLTVLMLPVVALRVAAVTVPSAVMLPVAPKKVIVSALSGPTKIF